MSDYPLDPDSDRVPASDNAAFPVACRPERGRSSLAVTPRAEDLDHPYSAYPAILLLTVYPEAAVYGLGIRHVRPYALFVFERWLNINSNDYFAFYLNDLVYSAADDLVEDPSLDRQTLAIPEEFFAELLHGDPEDPKEIVQSFGRVLRAGSLTESTSPLNPF